MTKNKLFRILVLIVLAALCAASLCACQEKKSSLKNYVTIGRILPLTGQYFEYAQGSLEAERAAVEELNENGGIFIDALDKKLMVRFLLEDSKSTKEGATEAAKRLIEEENVDVIVVTHTSETVDAVAKVCEEAKVPCFCADSDDLTWTAAGKHTYAFNTSPSLESKLDAFKEVWKEQEVSQVAIVAEDGRQGEGFAEAAIKYCSKNSIKAIKISNVKDAPKEIKDAKADAVLCYLDVDEYVQLKKTITAGDNNIKTFMLVSQQQIQGILDSLDDYKDFDGTYTAFCWAPIFEYKSSLTDQDGEELAKWWDSEFLSACPEVLGYKHGIIEITVEALKRAMAIEADAIIKAASELNINTIFGRVKFAGNYMDLKCGAAKWTYDAHSTEPSKWSQTLTPEEFGKEKE